MKTFLKSSFFLLTFLFMSFTIDREKDSIAVLNDIMNLTNPSENIVSDSVVLNKENLFDFWVGNWNVTWSEGENKTGKGINIIEKTLDGKVIHEDFKIFEGRNKGFKGRSMSVLNPQTGIWKQTWVDNSNAYLSFTHDRDEAGNLIFITSKIRRDTLTLVSRMVFKDVKSNSFTWDWEGSVDGGKTWKLNWRINYVRIKKENSSPSLTDFSKMIGTCNCKSKRIGKDGKWLKPVDATWTFKYIMDGKGVQDDFSLADGTSGGSIRQYNEKEKSWFVHYYASNSPTPRLQSWKGKKTKENTIVLYSPQQSATGEDGFFKLTFHDISKKGYKWKGEWVNKDESKINLFWTIECVK